MVAKHHPLATCFIIVTFSALLHTTNVEIRHQNYVTCYKKHNHITGDKQYIKVDNQAAKKSKNR